jgi:hypothetical protein
VPDWLGFPAVTWEANAWVVIVAEFPRILLEQCIIVGAEDTKVLVQGIACRLPILLHVVINSK